MNLSNFYYDKFINIWNEFCTIHSDLLELTCEEYKALLDSDLETIEKLIELKNEKIQLIKSIENDRQKYINELNQSLSKPISSVKELVSHLHDEDTKSGLNTFEKTNDLLIEIIESIQKQNKKNQAFLNKAMNSINDIKNEFSQQKAVNVYTNKGIKQTIHLPK